MMLGALRPLGVLVVAACAVACTDGDDTGSVDDTGDDVACADGVCVLSGIIQEDLTMTADMSWLLSGGVFIGNGCLADPSPQIDVTLEIEPGTTIYGESSTDGMLVVCPGSQIVADGTAGEPIVMTSSKAEGTRARGDWGGLIVNGYAPINACAEDFEEHCRAYGEGATGWYGGDVADDDSGVLRYVRVEFAGTLISPDNELNGIAFQGVGSGTEIDYIQIHQNSDDGVEFFGGTTQARHVLVTGVGDDMLDWTDGWQGKVQHAVLQQWADAGDNGIEADNNGESNDATPRSHPTLSNVTIIGSGSGSSDIGMLLREGTGATIANAMVMGWADACLDVDQDATFTQLAGGNLNVDYTLLDCTTPFDEEGDDPADVSDWFDAGTGNDATATFGITDRSETAPNYVPTGAATSGGLAPDDSFFDAAPYYGGVDPTDDWTTGWTTHAEN